MNILQINNVDTKGGAGKVAFRLKNSLREIGHEATMLVAKKYSDSDDVHLLRPYSVWRERILRKLSYWLASDLDLTPAGRLFKMPIYHEADVVHLHNIHSNYFNLNTLTSISKEKPIIWTFHDMWPITSHCAHSYDANVKDGFWQCPSLDIYPPLAWHNEKYLERKKRSVYERSDFTIVTPSLWLEKKVKASLLADKKIVTIHNGVDTDVFKSTPKDIARHELGLPQDKFIVLFLAKRGQSNPWKGGSYANEAIAAMRSNENVFYVDLGGDKEERNHNTSRVPFTNDEARLALYYSAADTLLYPSLADNCPLVVLEALACGLPIITFATGGIPEIVEHQRTGYIAKYKDGEDLISGLRWITSISDATLSSMRDFAVTKIHTDFTLKMMTQKYIELYQTTLER